MSLGPCVRSHLRHHGDVGNQQGTAHEPRTVMVTGVSRYLNARLARSLAADPRVDKVIGIDVVPPRTDIGRTEFVRADLRTPTVSRVVAAHGIDTVVHAGVLQTPTSAGGRAAMKEINVMGTLQLIAACQRVDTVRRLVLKSSASVYGSGPGNPAMFGESDEPVSLPRSGFPRDSVDVEDAARRLARLRSDVSVCMLRLANVVGPRVDTPLTRYFRLPLVPTVLGFDARLQLLHEDDAVAVLHAAAFSDVTGPINVAGDGVLMMSQAIARAGRPALPVPAFFGSTVGGLLKRGGLVEFAPEDVGFLTYGRVLDTARLHATLAPSLGYTTAEAFADFVRGQISHVDAPPGTDAESGRRLGLVPAHSGESS